jgi:hypothetical protein
MPYTWPEDELGIKRRKRRLRYILGIVLIVLVGAKIMLRRLV